MRIVLDTNTLVSGIAWEGPPRQILLSLRAGHHTLVTSTDLLDELTRVLRYPKLRSLVERPLLPVILEWIYRPEHLVIPQERIAAIRADPGDNLVLAAAVAGHADVINTGDRHLLRLVSFREIPILTAREFVVKYPS